MNCIRCGHPKSDHCAGGKLHGDLKEAGKMLPHARQTRCVSTHCENPMCSCIEYIESED
jgi:hypothetical protein